ncbi:MAG: RNA polymerase sigma factor [Planctomycetes bacterium]|nr:RNA polymerase sigma factor [Planctomycetota bacterium]
MADVEPHAAQVEQSDLVHRMVHGDGDAVRQLLAAHGSALLRFVRRRLGGPIEDAEEVVQDTFVTATRMAASFEGLCSVRTWLCALARTRVADVVRRRMRRKRTPDGPLLQFDALAPDVSAMLHSTETPIDELVERIEREHLVQALLDAMTPDQREVMLLRYVEGFSVAEVAHITERSAKAVERLLERAKEKPRRAIVRWLGEPAPTLRPDSTAP